VSLFFPVASSELLFSLSFQPRAQDLQERQWHEAGRF
jgi:hypothetical protein